MNILETRLVLEVLRY